MANDRTEHADQVIARAMRRRSEREADYREQALRIYPWICGRCGREFSRHNLRELTVHHRNHDHRDNPADGSNWELLCLYCHDNEHARQLDAAAARKAGWPDPAGKPAASARPFAHLADLLRRG